MPSEPNEPEKEVRELRPFLVINRGMGTLDPLDENVIAFEDYSPQVLSSDVPDEVEIPTAPKDSSAPGLASSSESHPASTPKKSENPALPDTLTEPNLTPPQLPGAEQGDGKPNQKESS